MFKENLLPPFEEAVIGLIKRKPFFGHLLMTCRRNFNTKIPTAGVSVESKGIVLHVNLEFLAQMSLEGRMAVLEHEMLHVLHGHPARYKSVISQEKKNAPDAATPEGNQVIFDEKMIFNVAADCAINQYIKNFKEVTFEGKSIGVTMETLQPHVKEVLLAFQHSEYYYEKIKKDAKDKVESGELQPMDDHGEWDNSDLTEEQAQSKIEKHLRVAKQMSDGKGLTSAQMELLVRQLESKIDWKAQLRSFAANAQEFLIESTRKKRNRRYGIIFPGSKVEPKFKMGVCVDTSGSVSDEELNQFFAEIRTIAESPNAEVYVIEADCVVQNVYKFEKKKQVKAKGRGGTAYMPAINKCMELEVDCIAYLGDFDTADEVKDPKIPFLWVGVRNSPPPADFGRVIRITA